MLPDVKGRNGLQTTMDDYKTHTPTAKSIFGGGHSRNRTPLLGTV